MVQINPLKRNGRNGGKSRRGFSLIELVIVVVIIGIIAAIAIPRMSRGSAGAADSALAQNLAILRNAIDMYQTEHGGVYPAGNGSTLTVEKLLLEYSNAAGTQTSKTKNAGSGIIYGPYLRAIPPLTVGDYKGKTGIKEVTDPTGDVPAGSTGEDGWLYNSVSGNIRANAAGADVSNKAYSSY
jgi:prepilin-type N-terminal cleavage/methylation domain-containing protein